MPAPAEIDFDAIRGGSEALLGVVPRVPAVYAWFAKFMPPDAQSSTAESFAAYLESEIRRPHMMARETYLPPIYALSLSSDRRLSEGKRQDLLALCRSESFRKEVASLLTDHAVTFSQPLYVGRAMCLRDRVSQHLSGASGLRKRLSQAGIEISRCRLTYLDLSATAQDLDDASAVPDVIEELLSKLFCPPFTARYG